MLRRWGFGVLMFAPFVCSAKYGVQPWVHRQNASKEKKKKKDEAEQSATAAAAAAAAAEKTTATDEAATVGTGTAAAAAAVIQLARFLLFVAFAVAFTEYALKSIHLSVRNNVYSSSCSGDKGSGNGSGSGSSSSQGDGDDRTPSNAHNFDSTDGYVTSAQMFAMYLTWVVELRYIDRLVLGRCEFTQQKTWLL